MFTSIDKAITALVMAVVYIITDYGIAVPDFLNEQYISNTIALLTPIAVWIIPNKAKDDE